MQNKIKGNSGEREVVGLAKGKGLNAMRIPLSGAGAIKGDVIIENMVFGVKRWKRFNKKIVRDVESFNGCFVREDRGQWLVVLSAECFLDLLKEIKDLENLLNKRG